jgi:hypothetical protein
MVLLCFATGVVRAEIPPADTQPAPDFDREVAVVLAGRCFDCHNAVDRKGKLDLTRRDAAMAGGKDGVDILPGDVEQSRLWHRVFENEMPPKQLLPDAEKQVLRRWIASGAKWGTDPIDPFRFTTAKRAGYDWWSLQPLAQVQPPTVRDAKWVRNPIDAFVLARLESTGIEPSSEADRRTLIRRLTFDLTGLPPTPQQVAEFENDPAPDAYERLVDRLLDSPDYGARWARHWLDVIRFGESNGFERDQLRPDAWRFRDWVIDAFNADMPYTQFVRMQLAGDVIKPKTAEGMISTSFLVCGAFDEVGENQQSQAMRAVVRQDSLEDNVAAVSQTFLGLTVNCGRCHDHKFDPILQKEYYQLASALSGVRHGERNLPADDAARESKPLLAAIKAKVAQLRDRLTAIERPARERLLAERQAAPHVEIPRPVARWDFKKGLTDQVGSLDLALHGDAVLRHGMLQLSGHGYATSPPIPFDLKEKTLEAWVALGDLNQRGGGIIGIQTPNGGDFDSIVFGEKDAGHWMAGSNFFRRTQSFDGPAETSAAGDVVKIAITYGADGTVTAYRNGQPYGQPYRAAEPFDPAAGEAQVLLGLRHSPPGGNKFFNGSIREARLYDRALSADEIAASAGVETAIADAQVEAMLGESDRAERSRIQNELDALGRQESRAKSGKVYTSIPKQPEVTHLLYRGSTVRPGAEVAAGGVAAVVGVSADFGLPPDAPEAERRLKLADWIADEKNPLFPRVIVNRLWQYHFGVGIVDTPNDFGFNGGRPTHPELLDWLANELRLHQWSLKAIHRIMVTSATYRQMSLPRADAAKQDASNRLLWRMNPRRIEAEALRDAVLQVAGQLSSQRDGPGYEDYYTFTKNSTFYESRDYVGQSFNRRSIYRTWVRSGRNPLLDVFDCPDPSTKTPRRAVTTTPLQALALMNDSFMLRMSDALSQVVKLEAGPQPTAQVERLYQLLLNRAPSDDEVRDAVEFLEKHGLPAFCRVMLNCNEFVTVD